MNGDRDLSRAAAAVNGVEFGGVIRASRDAMGTDVDELCQAIGGTRQAALTSLPPPR